jgi:hypothetical protein
VACAFYGCSKSILFGSLAARPEASWRSYSVPARRQGPVLIAALVRSARIIVAIVLIHRGVTPERRVSGGSCTQTEGIVMGRIDRSKGLPCELLRTPLRRSSQHSASQHLGEAFSTVPHPPKPGYIGQTVNARGFAYATCCNLQPLVASRCRGFGIESTADVLLTKRSTRTSSAFRFYGICRKNKEPTSGLEPLTPAHYE